ncbi:phage tail sheath family protein [Paraburkholderia aromaticivorans]|uniref:phage tail sheath family protein n=1 Tax=Paraburkholderia aromaticivorans TaxID=2026199 RepID=UPI001455F7D7|nr:phage tail sheath subtilisin-like domain-containing protein [Paraburkholderia aromaticivorans]
MSTRLPPPGADFQRPPGLYFDWQAIAANAPARLPSGVPLFVGLTGPVQPGQDAAPVRRLTRWQQFDEAFASDSVSSLLACAVRGFFENGGRLCYVMPVELAPDPPAEVGVDMHASHVTSAFLALFEIGGPLEQVEEIDLVCVPDIMTRVIARSAESVIELQGSVMEYCARMGDRFAILDVRATDPDSSMTDPRHDDVVMDAVGHWQSLPANHGALYFPWIRVKGHRASDGTARADMLVPPCGHIAGVYARSDRRIGVHKPPANELLEGALDLSFDLDDSGQTKLNGAGVNCLRASPGWGIRVWGARTLNDRSAWMYVNVTRVMLALKRWLDHDLRDLVFELNDPVLWGIITERIDRHCAELYRHGALKGQRPSEAYFVKCDAETNPPYSRDSGVVVAEVGLAPEVPSEFVIVRITQSASGVTVTGPTATV